MQNAKLRQADSFLGSLGGSLAGLGVLALVLLGICGSIYKVVSGDGLVAGMFERSASTGLLAIGTLLLVGLLAWFTGTWSSPRHRHRLSNFVLYGFAAAGLVYALRMWWSGTF